MAAAELLLKGEQEQEVTDCRQEAKQRGKAKASAKSTKFQPEPSDRPPAAPVHSIEEHVPQSGWPFKDSLSQLIARSGKACQSMSATALRRSCWSFQQCSCAIVSRPVHWESGSAYLNASHEPWLQPRETRGPQQSCSWRTSMQPRIPGKRQSSRNWTRHLSRPQSSRHSLRASQQQSPSSRARSMCLAQVGLPITQCRIHTFNMGNDVNNVPAAALREDQQNFHHGFFATAVQLFSEGLTTEIIFGQSDDCGCS